MAPASKHVLRSLSDIVLCPLDAELQLGIERVVTNQATDIDVRSCKVAL